MDLETHAPRTRRAGRAGPPRGLPCPVPPPVPQVGLLDGFTLRPGAGPARAAAGELPRGAQRLVAYLCLSRRPARPAVAGTLWPDVGEEQAHASLRSALWRLRGAAPGLVDARGGALTLAPGVLVDVQRLQDWARQVQDPLVAAEELPWPETALLGDLLPGWYDEWLLLERERLRQLRLHALEALACRLLVAGRHGEAAQAAHLAIAADQLRESAHRTLVQVHLAEGNVVAAVRTYQRFQALLRAELGVAPTDQMTRLVHGLGGALDRGVRAAS